MKSMTIIAFGLLVLVAVAVANPFEAEDDEAADEVDLALEGEDGKFSFWKIRFIKRTAQFEKKQTHSKKTVNGHSLHENPTYPLVKPLSQLLKLKA